MNLIRGKERYEKLQLLRQLKYQEGKFGTDEKRVEKITELEEKLKEKRNE